VCLVGHRLSVQLWVHAGVIHWQNGWPPVIGQTPSFAMSPDKPEPTEPSEPADDVTNAPDNDTDAAERAEADTAPEPAEETPPEANAAESAGYC
jgi:hypothetical protein